MNDRVVALALRRQRLQLRAAEQRPQLVAGVRRVEALLDTVDRAHDRLRRVREKTPLFAGAALVFAIAKPRLARRLAQRLWLGWALYRRLAPRAAPLLAAAARLRGFAARA